VNDQNKSAVSRGVTAARRQRAGASANDFVKGVFTELKRVTWPTREEWMSATLLTIILVVAIGLFTYGADQLFGWVFGVIHPVAR
jgi:preprotein translocase subunit SecE